MLYNVLGIIFISLAILVRISISKNKNDMPFVVYGLQKEKYEIIDKDKFNNIMLAKNKSMFIWFLISGILFIIIKESTVLALPSMSIWINIIFSKKAKKYVRLK